MRAVFARLSRATLVLLVQSITSFTAVKRRSEVLMPDKSGATHRTFSELLFTIAFSRLFTYL